MSVSISRDNLPPSHSTIQLNGERVNSDDVHVIVHAQGGDTQRLKFQSRDCSIVASTHLFRLPITCTIVSWDPLTPPTLYPPEGRKRHPFKTNFKCQITWRFYKPRDLIFFIIYPYTDEIYQKTYLKTLSRWFES